MIFLGIPFIMFIIFAFLSLSKAGDEFGNFWQLFTGGCFIAHVLGLFSGGIGMLVYEVFMQFCGWDHSQLVILAGVLAFQIYWYIISFAMMVLGAYAQSRWHYFH